MNTLSPRLRRHSAGFTLLEMTIVIGIVCIVCVMGMSGYGKAMANARKMKELTAARSLITAYTSAASDNNGELVACTDARVSKLTLPSGKSIGQPVSNRFAYRLAPYLDYKMEGTFLVNENGKQLRKMYGTLSEYVISAFPALGINRTFVGGEIGPSGAVKWPDDCVTRLAQLESPLLVFASAGTRSEGGDVDGYLHVDPPRQTDVAWATTTGWSKNIPPSAFGSVDARYEGYAVCAFTDGSVRMCSIDELRDMRLWSRNAAATGDPNYTISQ